MVATSRSRAFTLLEVLVVVSVSGIVIALLVVAVQRARDASARSVCANNIRQLGIAIQNYHASFGRFPAAATKYRHFDRDGNRLQGDRYTWCLLILPFIEQDSLYKQWVFRYSGPPGLVGVNSTQVFTLPNTGDLASGAIASQPIKTFLCAADSAIGRTTPYGVATDAGHAATRTWSATSGFAPLPAGDAGNFQWGLTSYQGSGGTASFGVLKEYPGDHPNGQGNRSDQNESRDGAMYLWQYYDDPTGKHFVDLRYSVNVTDISDGTSYTFLLGEKSLFDPLFDDECKASQEVLIYKGFWANPTGQNVFAGTEFELNRSYKQLDSTLTEIDSCYGGRTPSSCACLARTTNFSSNHLGGVNFAFCDGSVRFIGQSIRLATLRALSTRAGGEQVDPTEF